MPFRLSPRHPVDALATYALIIDCIRRTSISDPFPTERLIEPDKCYSRAGPLVKPAAEWRSRSIPVISTALFIVETS